MSMYVVGFFTCMDVGPVRQGAARRGTVLHCSLIWVMFRSYLPPLRASSHTMSMWCGSAARQDAGGRVCIWQEKGIGSSSSLQTTFTMRRWWYMPFRTLFPLCHRLRRSQLNKSRKHILPSKYTYVKVETDAVNEIVCMHLIQYLIFHKYMHIKKVCK